MKFQQTFNQLYSSKTVIIFLTIILFYCSVQFIPVPKQTKSAFVREEGKPLVIAHRGGAGLAPENTLLAFRLSEKLGVDAIELDVRLSKDKKLVVIHDETIDRTTNGTGYVKDFTLKELKKFDAGYQLMNEKGGYPYRNKGVTIPTLEEVFKEVKRTPLVIELKDPNRLVEKKVAALIKKYKLKKRVIVGSFNDDSLKRFSDATDGKIPIGTGVETVKYYLFLHKIGLDRLVPLERHAMQLPIRVGGVDLVTKRLIKAMRERNIAIHYWTINDEKTMKELIQLKVDGIITDYPNRLLDLLSKKGDKEI